MGDQASIDMASTVITASKEMRTRGRKSRPNYNHIHRNLLPVEIHPLPPLIPHNPLSLIAIALSYLTQVLAPPKRPVYNGYFSSATSSIHVTDNATIRALWEMGFFGRGNLSRSEPTWLALQQQKGSTAEEATGKRREDRRQQKLQRAKLEQEEIARQLSEEGQAILQDVSDSDQGDGSNSNPRFQQLDNIPSSGDQTPTNQNEKPPGFDEWKNALELNGLPTPPPTTTSSEVDQAESRPIKKLQRTKSVRFSPTIEAREFDLSSPVISPIKAPGSSASDDDTHDKTGDDTRNKEHLNLSLEEAFFLSYGLGVLNVYCENTDAVLPPSSMLSLFRRHSYFPARSLSASVEPDDPFMISYVVYHHYRALGWVVRSGVKFATDFLLYNRGPAFSHAEFAIVIIPSYRHKHWKNHETKNKAANAASRPWWWLHSVNRVQAQVHKQLVLCYVDIPPPLPKHERGIETDIGKELGRYKVRDIGLRRWTPNRSRD